jgi:hypothetical protein
MPANRGDSEVASLSACRKSKTWTQFLAPDHSDANADGSVRAVDNIELMPKKQVLGFRPTHRLEPIGHKRGIRSDHAPILAYVANPDGSNFLERQASEIPF